MSVLLSVNDIIVRGKFPKGFLEKLENALESFAKIPEEYKKKSLYPLFPFIAYPYSGEGENELKKVIKRYIKVVDSIGRLIFSIGLERILLTTEPVEGVRREPFIFKGFERAKIEIKGHGAYLLSALDVLNAKDKEVTFEDVFPRTLRDNSRVPYSTRPTYVTLFIYRHTNPRNALERYRG